MNAKILLIAFSAAAFTSCSTAYKSGQTPDDVYYSPARPVEERKDNDTKRDEVRTNEYTSDNNMIRMTIRDRRWREFDDDYSYNYNYSPYHYCTCACNNYGYYYNPYYFVKPVYYPNFIPAAPINSTPRMVNLNSYKNYNTAISNNPKLGSSNSQSSSGRYNNSNSSGSRFGNIVREVLSPSTRPDNNTTNSPSTNNNTRTYTPSTNTNSSSGSSGSSSGGSSSGGSVSRPGRG